jgi:excinuclease ABC subunit B
LVEEIRKVIAAGDRVLVTTLTKRMSEELTKYLERINIATRYIHSEVKTLDRVSILQDLRDGVFDVLVGVNLLREGLDLPEVALVAIMDADKEGFLRSVRSLTQTSGRAARNINGRVIMYADKITKSMRITIDETARRREKQAAFNKENNIVPEQIKRTTGPKNDLLKNRIAHVAAEPDQRMLAPSNDPVLLTMSKEQLATMADRRKRSMDKAAKDMDFMEAARLRDEYFAIMNLLEVQA